MQNTKSFPDAPPDRLIKWEKVPPLSGLRFYWFLIILCALAFATSYYNKNEMWGAGTLLLVFAMIAVGLLVSGASLQSTAFACVATLPNLNSYIRITNFSLTLIEIFMTLFIAIFLLQRSKMIKDKLVFLFGGLFLACLVSLIGSSLGLSSVGMLLRYGVLLAFVTILVSRPSDKSLFKPYFYGLLSIPLLACFTYAGEDVLFDIFTNNFLLLSRAVYSFQYPIWFSLFLPLLVFIRAPKFVVALVSLFIISMIVLSFARSIVVGTLAAGILFVCFYRNRKPLTRMMAKTLLLGVMGSVLALVAVTLDSFNFTFADSGGRGQAASNASRFEKMALVTERIKDHPFLGFGFGTANDDAFAELQSRALTFEERISPEFGPLNVLAEIGFIGGFFLFYIIIISFQYSVKCLRNRDIPMAGKLAVLITFGGFVSSFLNSNSLNLIVVYIFLVMPILLFKHWNSSSRFFEYANPIATAKYHRTS